MAEQPMAFSSSSTMTLDLPLRDDDGAADDYGVTDDEQEISVPPPPPPFVDEGCSSAGKEWTCEKCGKKFPSSTRYHKHMQIHAELKLCVCTFAGCGKSYARQTHLTRHVFTHKPASKRPFKCAEEDCDCAFVTRQKLDKHMTVHDSLQCDACGKRYAKRAKLDQHRKNVHGVGVVALGRQVGEGAAPATEVADEVVDHAAIPATSSRAGAGKKHVCEDCKEEFVAYRDLAAHKRDSHPKSFMCSECGKCYRREFHLREHQLRVHAEVCHVCPHEGCGQTFSKQSNLHLHERVVHKGLRPFTCRVCEETFAYRHVLNRHVGNMHAHGKSTDGAPMSQNKLTPRRVATESASTKRTRAKSAAPATKKIRLASQVASAPALCLGAAALLADADDNVGDDDMEARHGIRPDARSQHTLSRGTSRASRCRQPPRRRPNTPTKRTPPSDRRFTRRRPTAAEKVPAFAAGVRDATGGNMFGSLICELGRDPDEVF